MALIALTGAHRTGKSTLAKEFSDKHGVCFIQSSASEVFKEMGLDPAITYDFSTRIAAQEEILKRFEKQYATARLGQISITDRSPIDLLAYTLAEVHGETLTEENEKRVERYAQECICITNKYFATLLVVQPGIELVKTDGKASISQGYIEHLTSIILGLSVDERINVPHFYLPRATTDLKERIDALEWAINRGVSRSLRERDMVADGQLH